MKSTSIGARSSDRIDRQSRSPQAQWVLIPSLLGLPLSTAIGQTHFPPPNPAPVARTTAKPSATASDWDLDSTDTVDTLYSGRKESLSYTIKNLGPGVVRVVGRYLDNGIEKTHEVLLQSGDTTKVKLDNCWEFRVELASGTSASGTATGSP